MHGFLPDWLSLDITPSAYSLMAVGVSFALVGWSAAQDMIHRPLLALCGHAG
jgi:hypothetical protein